jgi:hypothetical protein
MWHAPEGGPLQSAAAQPQGVMPTRERTGPPATRNGGLLNRGYQMFFSRNILNEEGTGCLEDGQGLVIGTGTYSLRVRGKKGAISAIEGEFLPLSPASLDVSGPPLQCLLRLKNHDLVPVTFPGYCGYVMPHTTTPFEVDLRRGGLVAITHHLKKVSDD